MHSKISLKTILPGVLRRRTRNVHFYHRWEARWLVCCRRIGTYSPYARCQLIKPTAATLAGIPAASERNSVVLLGV